MAKVFSSNQDEKEPSLVNAVENHKSIKNLVD